VENVLKVTLWGKEVAAVGWNVDREVAEIEFFDSFYDKTL